MWFSRTQISTALSTKLIVSNCPISHQNVRKFFLRKKKKMDGMKPENKSQKRELSHLLPEKRENLFERRHGCLHPRS